MPEFTDHNGDFMSKSTILRRHGASRVHFDPSNPDHRASLNSFLKTGNWTVQFYPEYPYTDVPMTVLRKYAKFELATYEDPED